MVVFLLLGCSKPHRPNLLVITIDTLRADHLGSYGFHLARTPVLDQLAAEGVRFTDDTTAAPITMPAHSSIMTGLFPPAHGVRDNGAYSLGADAVTLAERMQADGYTTHAFVSALVLNRRYRLNQGFETYDDDLWAESSPALFMIRERQAPRTTDRVLTWLASWKQQPSKPFFTWIHYFDPHQPYKPSREDAALSVSPYDAEIAGVDRQIGRVLDSLRQSNLLDDTIVVVTADHGESLGEHGEATHAIFVYDATVHVPLMIRYPPLFAPKLFTDPVRSVDIFPTLLDALALPPQKGIDGRSVLGPMRGKGSLPPLPQYSESLLSEIGFGMAPLFAVRDGGFKFIRAPRPELYDLKNDPKELHNVIAANPRVAARLDGELTELINAASHHAVKASTAPMTRETEESLQALGYLASHAEKTSMGGIDPKDGIPLHNKLEDARHFAQQSRWSESEKLLNELLVATPRNVSALNVLGLINLKRGDSAAAHHFYQRSLEIDPQQFRIHGVLGTIALGNGDLGQAQKEYEETLRINPHFAEALANLGFVRALQGDNAGAEAFYQRGIAEDPAFPRVYRRLGDLFFDRGDYKRALGYYLKNVSLAPTDVRALVQAGSCERRLGQFAEADAHFRRAETLRPEGWIPTYNRACMMAVNGHPNEALALLDNLAVARPLPLGLVERDTDLASVRALPGYAGLKKQLTDTGDDAVDDAL